MSFEKPVQESFKFNKDEKGIYADVIAVTPKFIVLTDENGMVKNVPLTAVTSTTVKVGDRLYDKEGTFEHVAVEQTVTGTAGARKQGMSRLTMKDPDAF